MTDQDISLAGALPDTDYFELESTAVGAPFGIWVTRPLAYAAAPDADFPLVYVTDGNIATAAFSPLVSLLGIDLIAPVEPYVQVSIGYPGAGIAEASSLRNRDLIPPDEPVPAHLSAALEGAVAGGAMSREQADEMLAVLGSPHGDRFLEFVESELHPAITERYRVRSGRHSLFGYSYGGLFSLYALARQSPLFDRIGAGSPGLFGTDSQIFALLGELAGRGARFDDVELVLTVNELELVGPAPLYRTLGRAFLELVEVLGGDGVEGLTTRTQILPGETHVSGMVPSYQAFIRQSLGVTPGAEG